MQTIMSRSIFQRLSLIIGEGGLEKLNGARVFVFGLGGVGSWCAEALVRSGIGKITLIDSDTVCVTNINRQVQATVKTIGEFKAAVLKERLADINPECEITALNKVFSGESCCEFHLNEADYIVDAIDSLTNKLDLIENALLLKKTLFSSMGMAQKLDPSHIRIADIWETRGCPLARLVRNGLRRRNITQNFTVVYSRERRSVNKGIPLSCGSAACLCGSKNPLAKEWCLSKKIINGSAVTVTAAAGMFLASLVVNDIISAREAVSRSAL